jgi:hypothetical protein
MRSQGQNFPVIPVQPGIFAIVSEKHRFGTGDGEVNQALEGQFP